MADSRLRILHLEDDPVDAELIQAMLSDAGMDCEFSRAETRDDFLACLEGRRFDLILADYTLPGFDGLAALEMATEHCAEVPFLFVSGTLGEDVAAEAIKRGAVDYVVKSRLNRLVPSIRRALREVQERQQRHWAEEALRESEHRFRTLTEALPQIVWSAEPDGRLDYCNKRWRDYAGDVHFHAGGLEWQPLIHREDLQRTVERWEQSLRTGEPHQIEHRVRRHDGVYRWLLTIALPLRDSQGRIVKWLGSSTDIHDQKTAQEQLQHMNDLLEERVRERTRSLLEHQEQLRAMASDLTLTEQRERRRLAAELHDYLAQLLVACRMKTRLLAHVAPSGREETVTGEINELLEQSIKYTRTLIAELSPTILYEAGLTAAIHWLAEQMQRHKLRVEVQDEDRPVQMPDDQAVLVFQTIRELLINVAKHAMVYEAAVILDQSTAGELKVTVADNGVGFDPAAAEGPTSVGKYGLFSIRERLEALGGRFEIDTAPGSGTRATFTVPLPAVQGAEEPIKERGSAAAAAAPPAGRSARRITRVLLADDHHMVREGLRSIIETEPRLRVVGEAANGEEVLQQARVLQPDVVVMDINMPKMNGIEATRRLRKELPSVAVVALSMHEDKAMIAAMKEAGAVSYIPKGGVSEELSKAIREAHCMALSTECAAAATDPAPGSGNP